MALLIAVQTFVTERRGRSELIQSGDVAEPESWVVSTNPDAFRPLEVRWKSPVAAKGAVEADPSASPGVSPATLKHPRGAGRKPTES